MASDLEKIVEENNRLKEELKRLYGVERPFICGNTNSFGKDGMPDVILVCPSYGADGFALYKKYKDYSSPEY